MEKYVLVISGYIKNGIGGGIMEKKLPEKIDSWIDVADFVDKDTLVYSEKGDVYIF